MDRIIFHVDMDAFFASVEQLDNPDLNGKPVVVGADPAGGSGRGVVSAASYEARKYGIHSAMPISKAFKLCPTASFLPVRMNRYKEISRQIMDILHDFSPVVEPISVDEAFLDMTGTERLLGTPNSIAKMIKYRIKNEIGLTASAGVAPNKLVAKIASDIEKPNGLVIVTQEKIQDFLNPMPIGRLWGVGKVTERKLKSIGIKKVKDLVNIPKESLCSMFGISKGEFLFNTCRGIDKRPVEKMSDVKSISNEITFKEDSADKEYILNTLLSLSEKVVYRLRRQKLAARTLFLKIRFDDFSTFVRHRTLSEPVSAFNDIYSEMCTLFRTFDTAKKKVRLIGVGVSMLVRQDFVQQNLLFEKSRKKEKVETVVDEIKDKFGEKVIYRGKT